MFLAVNSTPSTSHWSTMCFRISSKSNSSNDDSCQFSSRREQRMKNNPSKSISHYITKYWIGNKRYATSWLQEEHNGKVFCFSVQTIEI